MLTLATEKRLYSGPMSTYTPPTFNNLSSATFAAATSVATSWPTGIADGDMVLLVVGYNTTTLPVVSGLAGWQANSTRACGTSYWYRYSAGDTAPTLTLGTASTGSWMMVAYTGCTPSWYMTEGGSSSSSAVASGTAAVPTAVVHGVDYVWIVTAAAGSSPNAWQTPYGFTSRGSVTNASGGSIFFADLIGAATSPFQIAFTMASSAYGSGYGCFPGAASDATTLFTASKPTVLRNFHTTLSGGANGSSGPQTLHCILKNGLPFHGATGISAGANQHAVFAMNTLINPGDAIAVVSRAGALADVGIYGVELS